MNTMHPNDALLVAHTHLDAQRASASAEKTARSAARCNGPEVPIAASLRSPRRRRRRRMGATVERSSTDCCTAS